VQPGIQKTLKSSHALITAGNTDRDRSQDFTTALKEIDMATTIIKYLPKHTNAGTEYREIQDDDRGHVLQTCIQIMSMMSEYDTRSDDDSRWVRDQWWHKRSNKLHKGQNGLNSPCSVIGGIVHNMMFKTPAQRDFSNKQISDLEYITQAIHAVNESIPAYRFQIGFE
jgi:hypothetical protein